MTEDVSIVNYAASTAAAAGTGYALRHNLNKVRSFAAKKVMYREFNNAFAQNSIFKNAAFKVLKQNKIRYTDLSDEWKKLTPSLHLDNIDYANVQKAENSFPEKANRLLRALKSSISENLKKSKIPKVDRSAKEIELIINGKNAVNLFDKVFVNFDKLSAVAFHEAGHAKNYFSNNLFTKSIQYLKHPFFRKIGFGVALASATLIPPKKDDEKHENLFSKTLGFLKKHCVEIAALSYAPLVMEEGLASIKGYKMAKDLLPANALKVMNRIHAKGLLSYIGMGVTAAIGIYTANKVKNALSS